MMPNPTTLLRRAARYLALVPVAMMGTIGPSSPAIASPAIASPATAAAVTAPEQTVTLSGDAVGPVRFGQPQPKAVRALKKLIGATEGGVQSAKGNCTIDAAVSWANFSVYFLRGRFVGYQTGNNLTDKQAQTFNGETAQGLRVGDTLADARRLYPGRVTASGENGGVYAVKTTAGMIRGYLSLEVSNPADKIRIVSISAGSVGCPAASPG
jgi:hypothetical protein